MNEKAMHYHIIQLYHYGTQQSKFKLRAYCGTDIRYHPSTYFNQKQEPIIKIGTQDHMKMHANQSHTNLYGSPNQAGDRIEPIELRGYCIISCLL
ncbi:hypothetical protein D3H65_28260 [Paraflavitalea soli]|uniref:Uncharacterized protein n=1 Tax=Paraflavitalea soli TaxID=2315862 RepID=A0A3B7MU62_9BACT|nr:hypothetical protein D3H65_28260 [Paraflavitalea soli]